MSQTILLVEDSPTDAAILSAAFEDIDCPCHLKTVTTGQAALDYLEASVSPGRSASIILLDLNLPGKTGHQVLNEIKSHQIWLKIPTIIFSSSNAASDISKSYALHANAYVTKPSDFEEYKQIAQHISDFWLGTAELPPESPSIP